MCRCGCVRNGCGRLHLRASNEERFTISNYDLRGIGVSMLLLLVCGNLKGKLGTGVELRLPEPVPYQAQTSLRHYDS